MLSTFTMENPESAANTTRRRRALDQPVPGTVLLQEAATTDNGNIVLQPRPSADPNDPLNWSNFRKYVNFGIVSLYTLLAFTIIDISPIVWQEYNEELGISYPQLNQSFAANNAGLAFGCIFFMPFALKYGRRPVYIVSTAITLATAIWQAKMHTFGDLLGAQLISGISTSISETLVQLTVADIFFVHQRGLMYGIYLILNGIGVFLAPVAAGYVAASQGWRWLFWWCTILFAVNLVLFLFFYEETKYSVNDASFEDSPQPSAGEDSKQDSFAVTSEHTEHHGIDPSIHVKTYRERLAFATTTKGPFSKFARHAYQPFWILFTFPIVAFTTLQVAALLGWYAVVATTEAQYFAGSPYNFGTIGIGLLNLPSFIGAMIGAVWGGKMSDWFILWRARRNGGIHEPESRLYLAIFPIVVSSAGLFLYGYSTAAGMPWIIPCIGIGLTMFGNTAMNGLCVTYLADCHREILGDALAIASFVRNLVATIIVFVLDPWINAMGLHNTFTCIGCLSLGIGLLAIPMIIWGKNMRRQCADRYMMMSKRQFGGRPI